MQTKYTYVSLELGHMTVCTSTTDGNMKTYWRHRVTLAYLAATDPHWKRTLTKQLNDTMLYFMRYSIAA